MLTSCLYSWLLCTLDRHARTHACKPTRGKNTRRKEEGQRSVCVYTVAPTRPCVPAGHMFEPVNHDLSSQTDSRKQLLHRIGSDCLKEPRGRGRRAGWAGPEGWVGVAGGLGGRGPPLSAGCDSGPGR